MRQTALRAGGCEARGDEDRRGEAKAKMTVEAQARGIGWDETDALRRAAAFRAAARHSWRVRFYKRAIVASAVFTVAWLVGKTFFNPFAALPEGVTLEAIGVEGSRVTMAAPKLNGFRSDARPYQVTAREAVQDVTKPQQIELRDLDARIAMGAQGEGHITARTGFYDSGKETMELEKDVRMTTDQGQELLMSRASIDFKAGGMVSREPVTAHLRSSTVEANSLRVSEGGRVLVFEGRVRTQIKPETSAASAKTGAKGVAPR